MTVSCGGDQQRECKPGAKHERAQAEAGGLWREIVGDGRSRSVNGDEIESSATVMGERIRTSNLRLRRSSVAGRVLQDIMNVSGINEVTYARKVSRLSVTPLSTFYRKCAGVPPVLGHFSDSSFPGASPSKKQRAWTPEASGKPKEKYSRRVLRGLPNGSCAEDTDDRELATTSTFHTD